MRHHLAVRIQRYEPVLLTADSYTFHFFSIYRR
jgi:hypothetical protein